MNEDQITPLYQDLATLEEMPAEAAAWSAMQEKNREVKQSRFVHYSIVDMVGVFIQFINAQSIHANGTGDIFGGIRTNLTDAEQVPNYLDKYSSTIRTIARRQLEAHLHRVNHPAGLNENLTDEDFSMTFAWNTLSAAGLRAAHPSARKEGPIWYGLFPTLIEPIDVSRNQTRGQWAHIINCYISLPSKQIRHSYLRQKKKDADNNNNEENQNVNQMPPAPRKKVAWQTSQTKPPFKKKFKQDRQENGTNLQPLLSKIDRLESKINNLKTPEQHYPALPPSAGDPSPKWERDREPAIPDC
jgi:hypothetical protein